MMVHATLASKQDLGRLNAYLVQWLVEAAYPRWSQHGIDADSGGFIEMLAQNGRDLGLPRRARVQPRQVYAFAEARRFGWRGDASRIVRRGIEYFTNYYGREDGLFRTLISADARPIDERAQLYDQAFALLGFAAAATALDARPEFERRALALRDSIERHFATGDGAFRSQSGADGVRESNPHMHLLEACLVWAEVGNDGSWSAWARDLVSLALSRFFREDCGALGESFAPSWCPAEGIAGRIIEPGHQFEWAWLLLRSELRHAAPVRHAALRLIAIGEQAGVRNHVAVNALLDDFTIHDCNARLWPQTERLKAAVLAARITDQAEYWSMAQDAAASLLPYLETPLPGLWFDVRLPSGGLVDSPAPASSFYHLVGAIAALTELLGYSAPTSSVKSAP
jgi:mannose/cellobiose epimerase-like protein (N-acyl-D-glucosamine 2-epimerase family)